MKESNAIRKLLIAGAVTAIAFPAIGVPMPHVNEAGETVVSVSYADLNLDTEQGLAALYSRLKGAAVSVCGPQYSIRDAGSLRQLTENRACYDELLSRLVAKFENDQLNEIHSG